MKLASIALAAAALVAAGAAQAADYGFSGALTSASPTFNRPLSTSSLSAVGTAAHYATLTFSVTASGVYTFDTLATGYDPFIALYGGSFVPGSALTNLLAVNDDIAPGNFTESGFAFALTAGASYVFVNTAFANTGLGSFSSTISGPGSVTTGTTPPIPEPSTYALMALGLAGVGLLRRRVGQASRNVAA